MEKEVKIPKYVLKILEDRVKAYAKFGTINGKLSDYCKSIGLDWSSPFYNDACLDTDIRIFCETDCGNRMTIRAIENQLRYNRDFELRCSKEK